MKNKQDLLFPLKSTSQVPAEEERFPSRAIKGRAPGQYKYPRPPGGRGHAVLPSPRPPARRAEAQGRPSPLTRPPRPAQGHRRGRAARRGTRAERGKEQELDLPATGTGLMAKVSSPPRRAGRRETGVGGPDGKLRKAGVCSAPDRVVRRRRVPPGSLPRRVPGGCPF